MTVSAMKQLKPGTQVRITKENDTDMPVGTVLLFEGPYNFYGWDGRMDRKFHAMCTWPECEHCHRDRETVWVEPRALEVVA